MLFTLLHRGHPIVLRPGTTVIGRSAGCRIVLDDQGVSRRHARLEVSEESLVLEDLGSANGVLVNGEPVERSRRLVHGDRVLIGAHELAVVAEARASRPGADAGAAAAPARKRAPRVVADKLWDDEERLGADYGPATAKWDESFLLGDGLRRLLDEGNVATAEVLVRPSLQQRLEQAKRGDSVDERYALWVASSALKLSRAGGGSGWLAYPFELYAALGRIMPDELVGEIEALVAGGGALDSGLVERYLDAVRAGQPSLDPADRKLLERLERLVGRQTGA
jgi:hypothetical protein